MTTPDDRRDPVDVVALAELDAGLPEPAEAARRRTAAEADPDAVAVLEALAATRAELAALPAPEVPQEVTARWAAALAAEAERRGGAPMFHVERRRRAPRRLLLVAAAAAVVVAGLGVLVSRAESPVPAVTRLELVALGRAAVGTMDVGELADPDRRRGCLRVVAAEAVDETLLGGRRVVLDGRQGVLLVLATGTGKGLRILTVDPGCGPDGGSLLAQLIVA
jgi:hypothetical protein